MVVVPGARSTAGRPLAILGAVALVLGGCGATPTTPPSPSASADARASQTPAPSPSPGASSSQPSREPEASPTPTPASTGVPAWWRPVHDPVRVASDRLHTVELGPGSTAPSPRELVVRQGIVYFTTLDAKHDDAIWATDLRAGSTTRLLTASDREFTTLDLSGDRLAWIEVWHEDPIDVLRVTRWQVRTMSLADGASVPVTLAEGGREIDGLTVNSARVEGDLVAISLADTAGAWRFEVVDARNGTLLRMVPVTAKTFYGFDLAGSRLVWSQGDTNDAGMFCHSVLMVEDPSATAPKSLARGAFVVMATGSHVVWMADPSSSDSCSGLLEHPRTTVASLAGTWKPVVVGAPTGGDPNLGDNDQQVTGDVVAWTEKRDYGESQAGESQSSFIISLRDLRAGRTVEVLDSIGSFSGSALGEDWLAWFRYRDDDTYAVQGVELADLLGQP